MKSLKCFLSIAVAILLFSSCKKATPDETPETVTKTTSLLCDGNGSSDYFPTKLNNKWVYVFKENGIPRTNKVPVSFSPGYTINKKVYLTLADSSIGNEELYAVPFLIRKDSANNTVQYEGFYQKDFILVPVAPKLNETWTVSSSSIRKVANLNASVKTDACNYAGLLQINHYPSGSPPNSSPLYRYFYKKGLGLVYVIHNPSQKDSNEWILTNVTLK